MNTVVERHEIAKGDGLYPARLLELGSEAPGKLYVMGNPEMLSRGDLLGVPGTRRPTERGAHRAQAAAWIATHLRSGLITGGAEGCELIAMQEAVELGVPQVVVAGTGADVLGYPPKGAAIRREVLAHGGAVVSAEPWGQGPRGYCFQKRNAFIAALARCVYLPECRNLSVADKAIELGRMVCALPGTWRTTAPETEASVEHVRESDVYLMSLGIEICSDVATVQAAIADVLTGQEQDGQSTVLRDVDEPQPGQAGEDR